MDRIWAEHPHTTLTACGESVGLPAGQMGNSEVGHLNLGAGAIVPQDLARIDKAVEDGSLGDSEVLGELMDGAERLHLIGLVSDGGVHSSDRHLKALVELAASKGVPDVVVHAFTDGRDTSPKGGAKFLAAVEALDGARVGSRDRALLRHGPRRPLGPGPEGVRPARARQGRAPRRQRRAGRQGRLRARRDRRVHRRHDGRRGGLHPPGRRGAGLQLPAGPHARDHARAGGSGLRRDRPRRGGGRRALRDAGRVRRGLGLPRRLPARAPGGHARAGDRRPRAEAAARRRDREVPARDVLLQRRRGGRARGRDVQARAVPARRPDLRPQAAR